jgi:hypothetical protein
MGEKISTYVLSFVMILFLCLMIWIGTLHSAEIQTNSSGPPPGNCKEGEVWRCIMGTCFSTLLYCPPVYENGKLICNTNCNTTTCKWNCECIKKDKPIDTNLEYIPTEDIYGEKAVEVLQIVIDQIKKREEGDFNKLIPNQQWVPIKDNIILLNGQVY